MDRIELGMGGLFAFGVDGGIWTWSQPLVRVRRSYRWGLLAGLWHINDQGHVCIYLG